MLFKLGYTDKVCVIGACDIDGDCGSMQWLCTGLSGISDLTNVPAVSVPLGQCPHLVFDLYYCKNQKVQ